MQESLLKKIKRKEDEFSYAAAKESASLGELFANLLLGDNPSQRRCDITRFNAFATTIVLCYGVLCLDSYLVEVPVLRLIGFYYLVNFMNPVAKVAVLKSPFSKKMEETECDQHTSKSSVKAFLIGAFSEVLAFAICGFIAWKLVFPMYPYMEAVKNISITLL